MLHRLGLIDATLTRLFFNKPKQLGLLMRYVSRIGRPIILIIFSGVAALVAYMCYLPRIGFGFGLCLVALSCGGLLKSLLRRERPPSEYVKAMRIKSYSFPSGHALGTLVLYGYVVAVAFLLTPWVLAIFVLVTSVFIVVATGYARVFLAAHYVGDVLGGWLLGGLALLMILQVIL